MAPGLLCPWLVCTQIREKLVAAVGEIGETLRGIHRIFEQDSEEVQREWVRFTQKVDRKLEDTLRMVIKRSLQASGDVITSVWLSVRHAVYSHHLQPGDQ